MTKNTCLGGALRETLNIYDGDILLFAVNYFCNKTSITDVGLGFIRLRFMPVGYGLNLR